MSWTAKPSGSEYDYKFSYTFKGCTGTTFTKFNKIRIMDKYLQSGKAFSLLGECESVGYNPHTGGGEFWSWIHIGGDKATSHSGILLNISALDGIAPKDFVENGLLNCVIELEMLHHAKSTLTDLTTYMPGRCNDYLTFSTDGTGSKPTKRAFLSDNGGGGISGDYKSVIGVGDDTFTWWADTGGNLIINYYYSGVSGEQWASVAVHGKFSPRIYYP